MSENTARCFWYRGSQLQEYRKYHQRHKHGIRPRSIRIKPITALPPVAFPFRFKKLIYELVRQAYFAEEDLGFTRDSTEFPHTEHVVLVGQDKHIHGIYNGTLLVDMYDLVHDIRLLKNQHINTPK